MDISEYQTNLISNEQRHYILLPASTESPRNISSEPMAHPPPFMSSVQEMRERYLARKEKHGDEEKSMGRMKKLVQSWKTENKSIYGNKVVRNLFFKAFPRIYRCVYLDYLIWGDISSQFICFTNWFNLI